MVDGFMAFMRVSVLLSKLPAVPLSTKINQPLSHEAVVEQVGAASLILSDLQRLILVPCFIASERAKLIDDTNSFVTADARFC